METKEDNIVYTAYKLFLRHGFKKVTMSDIAEATGLSRPTVYAAFANKDAIIAQMVINHLKQNHATTKIELPNKKILRDQLDCLFDIWIIQPFASIVESEGFKELMMTVQEFAPVECEEMYGAFENYVAEILKPHVKKKSELSAKELAKILTLASKGLKMSSETLPQLKRLVDGLISMTVGAIEK